MVENNNSMVIKPHKLSFILLGNGFSFILSLFLLSLIGGIFFSGILIVSVVLFVVLIIAYFLLSIIYKKEEYVIEERKIIRNFGGIFSDNSVEIKLDRVTQVQTILGFIQNKLFGTGNVIIKTAGSSSSRIVLSNIENAMGLYEIVQEKMRNNGYHLQKDKLVQEERPHMFAIVLELFQGAGAGLLVMFYIGMGVLNDLEKSAEYLSANASSALNPMVIGFTVLLLCIFGIVALLKYLDLRRRRYRVFTDTITYTEGFLTKNYSIIPLERVANSENTQGFVSRLFGLHDVVVSSEGSNNSIVFKNMVNGEQMIKNIKYLKNAISLGEKAPVTGEAVTDSLVGFTDTIEKTFKYNKVFSGNYKMDPLKTLISSVLLIIVGLLVMVFTGLEFAVVVFFVAVVPALAQIPQLIFTKYSIEESAIDSRYKFLSNKHQSFSVDRVTFVKVKESILDMLLGTCSVYFYSIGSSSSLVFKNVKKTEGFEKNILEKVGMYQEEKKRMFEVHFTLANYLKANIATAIFFFVLLVFSLLAIVGASFFTTSNQIQVMSSIWGMVGLIWLGIALIFFMKFLYDKFYFSKRFYKQKLAETYIESIKGIFFRTKQYARIDNIKGIQSTKYPLTKTGSLLFNISGEEMVQDQSNKNSFSISSLRITEPYLANVQALHNYLDGILTERTLDTAEKFSSGQDIGNSIVFAVIFGIVASLIFFSLHVFAGIVVLLIFVIFIGIVIWSIKVKKYSIQKDRILSEWGIFYKSRKSIVFEKFNFIEKNQGVLGKIFGNGVLSVYTLGSGAVDLRMTDVDEFNEMYDMLKD